MPKHHHQHLIYGNAHIAANHDKIMHSVHRILHCAIHQQLLMLCLQHFTIQHQRTASANAGMQQLTSTAVTNPVSTQLQIPPKNEHKLQYFDLDVANAPAINRQSMSVGNLNNPAVGRLGLAADPSARAPVQSTVVYNSVDFVKPEAFKRIREEGKKENSVSTTK
ncbi:Protein daughter of sevenless [Eumeta japonica]|uniref:Protein daughter of sevenless n=1 Tax=Eumeta variegata TaxID=151549 RepID=A0A4C1SJB3_EUMVA|nr:Protein daughter of sevenless [Eumeta japonica]